MREFANKKISESKYSKFFIKRFKRFFPALFFSFILSTLLLYLEKIIQNINDKPLNVFPERNILSSIIMLTFFQFIYINAFYILPNAWGVSVEFVGNVILMFKPLIKNNYGLLFLAITGILCMELGFKYELYLDGTHYGTSGLPALGRALVGFATGFLAKKNIGLLERIYSKKLFVSLIIVLLLGFRWPVYDITTNPFVMDLLFGVILVYIMRWNINKETILGRIAFLGGAIAYPFYLFHGIMLDLVNYASNLPQDFTQKHPQSLVEMVSRITATFVLTVLIAYPFEKILRHYQKDKKLNIINRNKKIE